MKIAFMGTPKFAIAPLEALSSSKHELVLIVTNPDAPKGRSSKPLPSPVKEFALASDIDLLQPYSLSDPGFKDSFLSKGADLIVVVAFGKIIPRWLLDAAPYGCINLHASLLPKYRGAAPIQRAIIEGERKTGVTMMLMDEGLDTGMVLLKKEIDIVLGETAGELSVRLSKLGADLLIEAIEGLANGGITPTIQNDSKATYAPKIGKEESKIDWSLNSKAIVNLIHGLNPSPGAFAIFRDKRLKIWRAKDGSQAICGPPGRFFFDPTTKASMITCGKGSVVPLEVQLEGKLKVNFFDFMNGHNLIDGEMFS